LTAYIYGKNEFVKASKNLGRYKSENIILLDHQIITQNAQTIMNNAAKFTV